MKYLNQTDYRFLHVLFPDRLTHSLPAGDISTWYLLRVLSPLTAVLVRKHLYSLQSQKVFLSENFKRFSLHYVYAFHCIAYAFGANQKSILRKCFLSAHSSPGVNFFRTLNPIQLRVLRNTPELMCLCIREARIVSLCPRKL